MMRYCQLAYLSKSDVERPVKTLLFVENGDVRQASDDIHEDSVHSRKGVLELVRFLDVGPL